VADIEARKTPGAEWRAAGAFASALSNAVLPTVSGIISLGSAIVNVVLPPRQLPPPYIPPSSLTPPPPPYIAPSSLTQLPKPRVTPPPYIAPSSLTQLPKPVAPKPVAPKPPVKLAPPTYKPRAT
jgi:hypothetical protein